jgi:hypothetical protein
VHCALSALQYYQTAEDLGLYGQDPTSTVSKGVFVATGTEAYSPIVKRQYFAHKVHYYAGLDNMCDEECLCTSSTVHTMQYMQHAAVHAAV